MGQLTKQFGKIKVSLPIPHLLNLQIDSYRKFLQEGVPAGDRRCDEGLEGVFHTVFPIEDFNKTASLEFVSYTISEPKYDQAECISKGLTYEAPMRIKVRLVVYDYDADENSGNKTIRDIKEIREQDIHFSILPLMTEKGTFIINGTERVIVNQLQRSPGIIFEHDGGKTHTSRKVLYSCRIMPMRGSWLDFDFDHKDILYVRIDRRRKMPATILFKAMGMTREQILDYFYTHEHYLLEDGKLFWEVARKLYRKDNAYADILAPDGTILVKEGKPITKRNWRTICESGIKAIEVRPDLLDGMFLAEDATDPKTGEVLAKATDELTPGIIKRMREVGIISVFVLHTRGTDTSSSIRDTLVMDRIPDQQKAQEEIYRRLRPSSPPTAEIAANYFDNLFRNSDYYDLSPVGRYKLNQRLDLKESDQTRILTNNDILTAIKVLVKLKDSHGPADDIDHLGKRRVRLVGELVENQYRIGLVRMERAIKERMSLQEISTIMP
ncbi:MAG: DNA-directed RNA polymerase subunit beta, partial [Desulfovibrio sp.]|nr:DNA-directed RNA polymerase subunit beta [Desulfovibrio sp.]